MKMKLLYLVLIVALINFSIPNSKAQTSGWLDSWDYRKSHILLQTSNITIDFQVNITCFYGFGVDNLSSVYLNQKCQTNFNDVRFTKDDGETLIVPYQQNIYTGYNSTYWLKIEDDLNLQNVLIYIYYHNSTITSLTQQASNVFIDVLNNTVLMLPMDEGIGTIIYDKSGNGNNGTISGATWVNGEFGNALSFDGNDYVNLGLQILPTTEFTYSLFVANPINFSSGVGMFISPNSGSGWFGYLKVNRRLAFGGPAGLILSSYYFSDSNSHFCVVTYDGVTLKIYVDLTEVYSGAMSNTVPAGNAFLGKNVDGNFFVGDYLDEVTIFSDALNVAQISNLYENYGDLNILIGSVCIREWSILFQHGIWGIEEVYISTQNTLTQNINEFFNATLFSSESYLSYISLLIIFAILAFVATKTFMGFLASILVSLALLSKYIVLLNPEGNFAYHILIVLFNLIFSFIFLGLSRMKRR